MLLILALTMSLYDMTFDEIKEYGESRYNYEISRQEMADQISRTVDFEVREVMHSSTASETDLTVSFLIALEWGMYNSIGESLIEQWADDILSEGMFNNVLVVEMTYGTPVEYRDYFYDLHYSQFHLASVVLVGDHPAPYFEMQELNNDDELIYTRFPCDFFYMDLDGEWRDLKTWDKEEEEWISEPDGIPYYDTMYPDYYVAYDSEISCARLLTSNLESQDYIDEVGMIREYLMRNHEWRTGNGDQWPKMAALYVDHDWLGNVNDFVDDLSEAFSGCIHTHTSGTNNTDYLVKLGYYYDWFIVWAHSNIEHHEWDGDSPTPSTTYSTIFTNEEVDAHSRFYTINGCYCGRYTAFSWEGYFAGHYLFASDALGVISCTKAWGMFNSEPLFHQISEGRTIGYSFRVWFNGFAQSGLSAKKEYLGEVLFGDPSLIPLMHRNTAAGSGNELFSTTGSSINQEVVE